MYCLTYVWHFAFFVNFFCQCANLQYASRTHMQAKVDFCSVQLQQQQQQQLDNSGLQFMGKSLASQDLLACYSNCYLLAVGDGRAAAPLSDSQSFS